MRIRARSRPSLAAIALLFAVPALAAEADWPVVAPEGFGFEARMPAAPKRSIDRSEEFIGTVETHVFHAETAGEEFDVTVVVLPRMISWIAPTGVMLDKSVSEFLERTKSTERSVAEHGRGDAAGRTLEWTRDAATPPVEGRVEFYVTGGRMFSFIATRPKDTPTIRQERFHDSIRFVDAE